MDNKDKRVSIGGNYEYSSDGTLYYSESKEDKSGNVYMESTAIANHTPLLKEQRVIDNGIEATEELVFSVLRDYRRGADTGITLKEILSQTPNIKFGAACRISLGRGAKARYSEAMQIQCENAPVSMVYQHTGYTIIEGERIFLNGSYSITKEGLTDKHNVVLQGETESYCFVKHRDSERFETLLQMDCTAMHRTIDEAKEYLLGACNVMFKPKTLTARYNDFFTINEEEKDKVYSPEYENFIQILDYVPQLQDFVATKTSLSSLEEAKIDWYYRNLSKNATDVEIIQYTKKVMEKHPEDVELLKLSKYLEYVEIVETSYKEK